MGRAIVPVDADEWSVVFCVYLVSEVYPALKRSVSMTKRDAFTEGEFWGH